MICPKESWWWRKISHAQSGFTLLEVLVTMVILTVGVLGTEGLTDEIIRGNFFSKNITSATVIAQTQLEAVQNAGYTGTTTSNFPTAPAAITMGGVNFTRTTTIANSPALNMKTISVSVIWNEANNTARSVTLETILAQ